MQFFKYILFILGVIALIVILTYLIPTEEEQEQNKMVELVHRNELEKQLVGKWNHNDFPAGLNNNNHYHLLSANLDYTYRGSTNAKLFGTDWYIRESDSILFLKAYEEIRDVYKVKTIEKDHIRLQIIKDDSLGRIIDWYRHP